MKFRQYKVVLERFFLSQYQFCLNLLHSSSLVCPKLNFQAPMTIILSIQKPLIEVTKLEWLIPRSKRNLKYKCSMLWFSHQNPIFFLFMNGISVKVYFKIILYLCLSQAVRQEDWINQQHENEQPRSKKWERISIWNEKDSNCSHVFCKLSSNFELGSHIFLRCLNLP